MALPTVDAARIIRKASGVATPLLADVPDTGRFDSEWESAAVSEVLATLLLPPIGVPSTGALREYIERSEASRAYYGALERMAQKLDSRGEVIPSPLDMWRAKAAGGLRRRPARKAGPPQRPVNPAHLLRYVQIQFTIAVLQRVGVKPRGYVSGCGIVSEALELSEGNVSLSEDSVRRIWDRPFTPEFRKHSKAIATRTGPFHTTEA